jgi:hypothetical protein
MMGVFKMQEVEKFEGDVSMRAQAPLVDMTGGIIKYKDEVGGEAANLVPKQS